MSESLSSIQRGVLPVGGRSITRFLVPKMEFWRKQIFLYKKEGKYVLSPKKCDNQKEEKSMLPKRGGHFDLGIPAAALVVKIVCFILVLYIYIHLRVI